jgi:dethiobiotin synthetase
MKPICCGDREDARRLLAASAEGISIEELNPIWLQSPVAAQIRSEFRENLCPNRVAECVQEFNTSVRILTLFVVAKWPFPRKEQWHLHC